MVYRGELVPNCLLTRYPVCFVHGRKSIFNAFGYWKGMPEYLRAHGYKVFELAVPWRAGTAKRADVLKIQIDHLARRFGKVHLIARDIASHDIESLAAADGAYSNIFQSVTVVKPSDVGPGLLQHCISLAENDLTHAP